MVKMKSFWIVAILTISCFVSFSTAISASFTTTGSLSTSTIRDSSVTLSITVGIISMTTSETLQLVFPSVRTHFNIAGTSVTCSSNYASQCSGTVTFTCTYTAATDTLVVTPSASISIPCFGIVLQFSNYVNGQYATTETVNGKAVSGSTVASTTAISLTYTYITMSSVTLTPQSLVVADTNKLKVTFTVGTFDLTSDFNVIMTFPARFSTTQPYFSGSITCSNATTNIITSPSCSVSNDGSSAGTIKVTSLYTSTISSTSSAGFFIANIANPISTATISGITMTIADTSSDSAIIAYKSGITMAVTTAKTATFSIAFVNPTTIGVYSTANSYMLITVTPGVYIASGCIVTVVFPSEISYSAVLGTTGIITSLPAQSSTTLQSSSSACAATTTNTDSINSYITVVGPPQVKDTSTFSFTMTTTAGNSIATATAYVPSSSITTGTITTFIFTYITGASTVVQTSTTWKIGFTLGHKLVNPWKILVTYPSSDFTISACTPSNGIGFTVASTTCSVSGNTITIIGTYDLAAGAVSFEGLTGTNPNSVFSVGSFTVNSFNTISGADYAVGVYLSSDTSFTGCFTPTTQTLTSVSVSINTPATYSYTGLSNVQYDFTVVHKSTFYSGYKVIITIPSSNCLTMYGDSGTSVTSYTLTSAISSTIIPSTSLTFSYAKFQNPRSTNAACGSFTIAVTTSTGNSVESGSGGSITVASANTLSTFQITANPTSLTNGQTASYSISSTQNSNTPLISGDRYYITFPSEIDISSASCTTITCSRDSGRITFSIPASVPNPVSLSVDNLVVQSSTTPISTAVSVQVVTSSSTSQIISVHSTTTVPTTTNAGAFTSATLTQGSYVASTATTYTFAFTLANQIPVGGVILIVNTPALTFSLTGGCTSASGSFGACTYDSTKNGVVVPITTAISKSTAVSISIATYTNPSIPSSSSFTVGSYTTSAYTYKVDALSSGLTPSLECTSPCKTCTVASKTTCTSCFTDQPSITQKYYTSALNTCTSSCGSSYSTDTTNYLCTLCNTVCATCADNAVNTCTSCSGTYSKFYSSYCYTSCSNTPVATYESSGTCYACDTNCKTCSTTSTYCTSCTSTNLYNNVCQASCPSGYVAISNVCTACDSICNTCSGTTSYCTSCKSTAPILHLNTCITSCPTGYITSSSGSSCDVCTSPCATCSSTVTNCVTCVSGYYLDGATCVSSCGSGKVEISGSCYTCQGGCATCTISRTQCTSCSSPLLLNNTSCLSSCPSGYTANTAGTACILSTSTSTSTSTGTTTTTTTTTVASSSSSSALIYFPFSIAALFLFVLSLVGLAKDPRSQVPTTFVALLSIAQFLYYLVQIYLAYKNSKTYIMYLTGLAFADLLLLNFVFTIIFCCISCRDQNFKYWSNSYCKMKWFIEIIGIVFTFKFMKMYYSSFFGLEHFCASWNNVKKIANFMNCMCVFHILLSICPCIFADVIGFLSLSWGDQLFISIIDTCILELIMALFIFIEFCTLKSITENNEYKKVEIEPNMSAIGDRLDDSNDNMEKKLRADALKRLIEMMKGNKGFMPNNKIEECIDDDDRLRRRNSLPAPGNPREELSDRPRSYPLSPRARKDLENPLINPLALGFDNEDDEFWMPQDNVYAESKPPDPLGKIGKNYKDGDTQTFVVGGDHDIPFRDDDSDEGKGPRTKGKAGRGRGRRGRFEEKIRDENQYMDQDSDELNDENELDVINEEDDILGGGVGTDRKKQLEDEERRKLEEDLRKKIEEEDNQLLEEEKRLATNKSEEDFIKEAEESLSKSKLDNVGSPIQDIDDKSQDLNDTDIKVNPDALQAVATNVDGMQIPPSPTKRTFNENDIKGDLEKNDEGHYAPTMLQNGVMVDKFGRKVNEKGFLVNPTGDVVDAKTNKQMFDKDKLTPNGDIPQPFKFERYNFNPHDITGAYAIGKNGKPILHETPDGKLVDDNGRQVNENGIMIDEEGNVIDKYGRKKLDKNQLTNKGDLPAMLNYEGKQFRIQDVMGEFDKDPRGDIIFEKNNKGEMVDKKGRRVNDKGYLINDKGDIIDKKGTKIWDKDHLYENEFPKIFPFSSFNIDSITGNFDRDAKGNPILKPAGKDGQFYDKDGKLVNKRGYLINPNGDIIDKNGNLVFKKNVLKDGEIPAVFRNGLIRQDSSTSLSRLMSEIDKNQDSDLDILKDQMEDFEEEEKGNTSVDSLMEDTPSNYNIANQRFDEAKYKKEPEEKYNENDEDDYEDDDEDGDGENADEDEEDEEDNDSITGPAGVPILNARQPKRKILRKKKKKKRRKKPKLEFEDPTTGDIAMAKAYGGEARGRPVRKLKRKISGVSSSSKQSRGFSKPARRDQFFKVGGSVSGREPMHKHTLKSTDSKSKIGPSIGGKKLPKGRPKGTQSKASNSDFEKLYDKNLDDFLENSDFDFESIGPQSRKMSRQGSARGGHRLKGLESIYLQRLEANPAKEKRRKDKNRKRGKKNDDGWGDSSEQDDLAGLIEENYRKMKKKFAPQSARGKNKDGQPEGDQPNIFTGNFSKYKKESQLDGTSQA